MRYLLIMTMLAATLLGIGGCAAGPLLSNVTVAPSTISPNGDGNQDVTILSYRIGQPSTVSIWLEDQHGQRYILRDRVRRFPSTEHYQLRFDGTVPEGDSQRRVLPDGTYTYVVEVYGDDGSVAREQGQLVINGAAVVRPEILDLAVIPNPFSPDEDAIDDVTNFTYRLPITATISIDITDSRGQRYPLLTRQEQPFGTQRFTWGGRTIEGALLPGGVYTYTITAEDTAGNRVVERGSVTIASAGQTEARITYAYIAPSEVMRGHPITVTVRVKNTGQVPIRTFGPPSGFRYTTNDTFASVENHRWADRGGGYWRVGLGYEGNGNAYPFRWALSNKPPEQWKVPGVEDWLNPGEEVEITGSVVIYQFEDKMTFFVGLIHEGVSFPATRQAMKVIKVGLQ